jgi:hypothetical protein
MTLLHDELTVVVGAYVLAAIPIGLIMLAGRMSPVYAVPGGHVLRWWSWFALVIVAFAVLMAAAGMG